MTTYPSRQLILKRLATSKIKDDVEQLSVKLYKFQKFLIKLNLPSNFPLKYLSKKMKTYIHKKACTKMFTLAIFVITKTWKQPRRPSTG